MYTIIQSLIFENLYLYILIFAHCHYQFCSTHTVKANSSKVHRQVIANFLHDSAFALIARLFDWQPTTEMFKLAFWQICSDCTDCCKDTPSCKQAAAEVAITNLASLVFYKLSDQLHDSPLTDRAQSEIVKDEIPRSPAQPYRPSVSKVKALLILFFTKFPELKVIPSQMWEYGQIFNLGIGEIRFSCHREISRTRPERKCGVCPRQLNSIRFTGVEPPIAKYRSIFLD